LTRRLRVAYIGAWQGVDHFVAQILEATGDPLALGGGLDQDAGARATVEHLREPVATGTDTALEGLALVGEADSAFAGVHIDANMLHG
jgi:hypothetical protein